jgi:predicted Zn finger-like uncharacterized protein
MRIACPSCAAEYEVPEAALAAGPRRLRCARCGHQFDAAAPPAEPPPVVAAVAAPPPPPEPPPEPPPAPMASPAPAPPEPAPEPDLPAREPPPPPKPRDAAPAAAPLVDPPPQPPRGPLILAWLISLAVLGGLGWALWRYRAAIVESFPPAARLYELFGP